MVRQGSEDGAPALLKRGVLREERIQRDLLLQIAVLDIHQAARNMGAFISTIARNIRRFPSSSGDFKRYIHLSVPTAVTNPGDFKTAAAEERLRLLYF